MDRFYFYDPYTSFFAGLAPAFRDDDGKVMKSTEGLISLLALGREISELIGPLRDREEWNSICHGLLSMEPEFRKKLAELSGHPNVSFVNSNGEPLDLEWDTFTYPDLVSLVYQSMLKFRKSAGIDEKKELGKLFAGPFFLVTLMDIDDAIFHALMGADASTNQILAAGITAMRSLAIVKELTGAQLVTSEGFARKGAAARHAPTRELRNFAINLYRTGKFPSAHKASIALKEVVLRESTRLNRPLSEDRAQKTIYDWLRNADK